MAEGAEDTRDSAPHGAARLRLTELLALLDRLLDLLKLLIYLLPDMYCLRLHPFEVEEVRRDVGGGGHGHGSACDLVTLDLLTVFSLLKIPRHVELEQNQDGFISEKSSTISSLINSS